jgi:AraC-like DNA-binding protein
VRLATLRDDYAIHNVVAMRPELPFFLLRWDGKRGLEWMDLGDPRQSQLKPFHFEIHFGKEARRDEHYFAALANASRKNETVVAELFGFCDLFHAIGGGLFLFAGQFYRQPPDWATLCAQWHELSARAPSSGDPDFTKFVHMALALPVLTPPVLEAIEKFAELYAEHLRGEAAAGLTQERVDRLNREALSRSWPIEDWVESVLHADKFHLAPWRLEGGLTEWMKEGMGIARLPTTAVALMPLDARQEPLDPLQTLVRNAAIQRACIELARELPETAATRLGDYGVSIITSTRPGKSAASARVELRERAQRFAQHVHERFGLRAVCGIGPQLAPGAPLHPSHREAVLALHMCVQLDRDVLFYDEHGGGAELRWGELLHSARALREAFARESATEVKMASDRYVQLVLRHSGERTEVARGQFLATLSRILEDVLRRWPMQNEARERFAAEILRRVEEARSLAYVIEGFGDALQRLCMASSQAWHGPAVMRLEGTLQYLRENFSDSLRLPQVARRAGFSVPAFGRAFRVATGTSFLRFLRAVRVEHAKRLLATTPMTIDQVAQSCGFQSQHHLIRSFKKVTAQTPGAYRLGQQNDQIRPPPPVQAEDAAFVAGKGGNA